MVHQTIDGSPMTRFCRSETVGTKYEKQNLKSALAAAIAAVLHPPIVLVFTNDGQFITMADESTIDREDKGAKNDGRYLSQGIVRCRVYRSDFDGFLFGRFFRRAVFGLSERPFL